MRFYDLLQMDPAGLKERIRTAETKKDKIMASIALPIRPTLIVLFAIALIAPLTSVFGAENNSMLVALFCILLSVRFVDFGYCVTDSVINLGITFFLLFAAPIFASQINPVLGAVVNFSALLFILIMTSHHPEMGNGGLYGFSYVFLAGNPVTGVLMWKRGLLALGGFIVCGIIFYVKHKGKNKEIRFSQVMQEFQLSSKKSQWQIRLALGISLLLLIGTVFHMERLMWAGFACSSLLSTYLSEDIKERSTHRLSSTIIGTLIFLIVYQITPESLHSLFGPFCGICLGFCVHYRYKTVINCFSALLLATSIYGLSGALILRIWNNVLGVAFACLFVFLFEKVVELIERKKESAE